jgi:hypothetical protein
VFTSSTPNVTLPGDTWDLFQSIVPVTLGPGDYSVVAVGFNGNQLNGNVGNSGGTAPSEGTSSIIYVGSGRFDGTAGLYFPTTIDSGPPNRYEAGTFATPDGGTTLSLLGLAIVGLAGLRRKLSL